MDIDIIKTVLDVARLKSFSAAALSVPCSQSSVSRRVEYVEEQLGVKIFDRPPFGRSREVTLTPAGEQIIKSMAKIVDAYTELYETADELSGSFNEKLSIGARSYMMPPLAPTLIKNDFYEVCPSVALTMKTDDLSSLIASFRTRHIDAVVFPAAKLDKQAMQLQDDESLQFLGTVPLSVGFSVNDPLAKKDTVTIKDLDGRPFLLNIETSADKVDGVYPAGVDRLRESFENHGCKLNTVAIPHNILDVRYQKAIDGEGIVPSHTPKEWRRMGGLKYALVEDSGINLSYYILCAKGRKSKALEKFIRFISSHLN